MNIQDYVDAYVRRTVESVWYPRGNQTAEFHAFCRERDKKRGIHRENPEGAIMVEATVVVEAPEKAHSEQKNV